jgi:hypothetical protein
MGPIAESNRQQSRTPVLDDTEARGRLACALLLSL